MKWLNDVSPDTFTTETAALYDTYKAAYRIAKAAREAFETSARDEITVEHGVDGDCVAFNYRFGKLSIGIGEARVPRNGAAKPKQSLADWLAERA